VLGKHPKDKQPVELHAGRYGPYVKHGAVNATLTDADRVDSLTLDEALDLLAAKTGKPARVAPMKTARSTKGTKVAAKVAAKTPAKPVARKRAA